MSKIEVNTVEPQCGTTLTLGGSGDTVTLGSGASQSGFGRAGSVNWQTSIKTATFTAASGEGYFCNTSGGAFTVNLPSSPSVGDIVAIKDYASSFDTQNLTIGRGGSNLNGEAVDSVRDTENESLTLVYADATKGWLAVEEGTGFLGQTYMVATGGTITCCGDYKIHTFTGPGTFTVCSLSPVAANNVVDYLVVAGGGSGGTANGGFGAGAGGAGGFRASNDTCMPAPLTSPLANPTGLTMTATAFPISVGGGGAGFSSPDTSNGNNGNPSTFSTITSTAGGYGAGGSSPSQSTGGPGGSGGGGWGDSPSNGPGGSGNTPPVSPPQGNDGGTSIGGASGYGGGGGGGAGAAGGNSAAGSTGGPGGIGSFMVSAGFAGCNGTTGPVSNVRYFSGGGGGSSSTGVPGGAGGGGKGGDGSTDPGGAGTANTGGGGGGSRAGTTGAGGSGIVIIRYKYQ